MKLNVERPTTAKLKVGRRLVAGEAGTPGALARVVSTMCAIGTAEVLSTGTRGAVPMTTPSI